MLKSECVLLDDSFTCLGSRPYLILVVKINKK